MGFFRAGESDAAEPAQPEPAGLSSRAEAQLEALATDGSVFTSGLSVDEFALLTQLGPQPLAQVMGASVVRTGWQYLPALPPGTRRGLGVGVSPSTRSGPVGPWSPPPGTGGTWQGMYTEPSPAQIRNYLWHAEVICELDVLSTAWNLARRRAIDRLAEEATTVDADAVVGVHLHRTKIGRAH